MALAYFLSSKVLITFFIDGKSNQKNHRLNNGAGVSCACAKKSFAPFGLTQKVYFT